LNQDYTRLKPDAADIGLVERRTGRETSFDFAQDKLLISLPISTGRETRTLKFQILNLAIPAYVEMSGIEYFDYAQHRH